MRIKDASQFVEGDWAKSAVPAMPDPNKKKS